MTHPQAPECPDSTSALISTDQPHNCNADEATQNSSNQNLTRKVKDWRDWTYTDGSLQKNEVGQDTGSGVYHPHLNVSHYVNPKDMSITNTISRPELAAMAAAVIHLKWECSMLYHLSWWGHQSTSSGAWSWGDAKTFKYIVKVRVLSTNLVIENTYCHYTYSSHSTCYGFTFNLIVLGVGLGLGP